MSRVTAFQRMHAWVGVLVLAAALVSLALVARSLFFTYVLARPVPYLDQWEFERSIPRILDGTYTIDQLFAQHNEHRLFTSRIIYILDVFYADGSFYLCNVVLLATLLAIAVFLAAATTADRRLLGPMALLYFGLLCSPAQWENLSSGFQVAFPFVDLFFILSLYLLLRAERALSPRIATTLLTLATLCDFLAVFSMANGVVAIVPVLFTRLFGGLKSGPFWIFVVLHLIYAAAFFVDYHFESGIPSSYDLIEMTRFAILYLGSCLRGVPHGPSALGVLDLVVFVGAFLAAFAIAFRRRRAPDPPQVFFLGVMLMMVCNGYVTAHGRASLGVWYAIASRYAIQSIIFQIALLSFLWRSAPARLPLARASLIAGFLGVSVASNASPMSLAEWESRSNTLQTAGAAMANHVWESHFLASVYPAPVTILGTLAFIAAHKLGPFSPTFGRTFEPAANAVLGADLATLDTCLAAFGASKTAPDWVTLEGWAFDKAKPSGNGFVIVFDETAGHRTVGFGRQSALRPDVDQALGVNIGRSGFEIGVNLGPLAGSTPHDLTLVLVPEASGEPSCKAARTVDVQG